MRTLPPDLSVYERLLFPYFERHGINPRSEQAVAMRTSMALYRKEGLTHPVLLLGLAVLKNVPDPRKELPVILDEHLGETQYSAKSRSVFPPRIVGQYLLRLLEQASPSHLSVLQDQFLATLGA